MIIDMRMENGSHKPTIKGIYRCQPLSTLALIIVKPVTNIKLLLMGQKASNTQYKIVDASGSTIVYMFQPSASISMHICTIRIILPERLYPLALWLYKATIQPNQ